ncbi:uncharacterized protein LOC126779998 [Nymphalis io]|uniref:uncharacterized protein LOC126779998 n=1 Tax=Inachis io TaxID=171585 RepID=UPI00216A8C70|nr:uncharacterized protein LOC126779998 [Nymphalis io]XP_050360193.1 uncharacterized protein LOC126779998 [Nymphalis io]XP_050360194.1 uncharacterized protein LOC126779998 [Nymphalis io]
MWSASSKESNGETKNIPALMNFNIYDILKPIKVETVDRNNVKISTLIDITPDENKNETDFDLNGSYLDKVKKTEFTLVDLFENLFVSPQHVVKNDSKDDSIDLLDTPVTDVRFETGAPGVTDEIEDTVQYNKARTFDEIFDSAVSLRYPKLEPVGEIKISEDAFDAVDIKTLNIEYQKPIDKASGANERATTNAILGKENISKIETYDVNYKHLTSLYEPTNTKQIPIEDNNFDFYKDHIYNNISQMKLQSLQNPNEQKRNVFQADSVTRYRKDIKSLLIDQNKPPIIPNSNGAAIPILQTIKKDNKVFNKRRVVVKDSAKAGFTKGPNIYEKSIVLPQIVKRLGERKRILDEKKNIKRKLILDKCNLQMDNCSGIDNSRTRNNIKVDLPVLQPEVLMKDCNRERLRALKIRRAFQEFNSKGEL